MHEYARTTLVGPKAGWAPHNSVHETTAVISLFIQQAQEMNLKNLKNLKKKLSYQMNYKMDFIFVK